MNTPPVAVRDLGAGLLVALPAVRTPNAYRARLHGQPPEEPTVEDVAALMGFAVTALQAPPVAPATPNPDGQQGAAPTALPRQPLPPRPPRARNLMFEFNAVAERPNPPAEPFAPMTPRVQERRQPPTS